VAGLVVGGGFVGRGQFHVSSLRGSSGPTNVRADCPPRRHIVADTVLDGRNQQMLWTSGPVTLRAANPLRPFQFLNGSLNAITRPGSFVFRPTVTDQDLGTTDSTEVPLRVFAASRP
jgi:hypothetical protein